MAVNDPIFIRNIYYMLTYAFQVLKQENYAQVEAEKFEHIQDLLAAILVRGTAQQVKQGLCRSYITRQDALPLLRGKLDLPRTLRHRTQQDLRLACEFDELSENTLLNQILKTTITLLLRDSKVSSRQKEALRKILIFFNEADLLSPSSIPWSRLTYQRSNRNYELLINICYFILDGMVQTTQKGAYRITHFSDEHMARLYERFILAYYRRHHSYLDEIKSAEVAWDLTGENSEAAKRLLPAMQTDIFLRRGERVLIIDAKYYRRSLQQYFGKQTLHSNNLYQIFTYVKNQDKNGTGQVAGLLLYAKTDEEIAPDCTFRVGGNRLGAASLDLGGSFETIQEKLDCIVWDWFGKP